MALCATCSGTSSFSRTAHPRASEIFARIMLAGAAVLLVATVAVAAFPASAVASDSAGSASASSAADASQPTWQDFANTSWYDSAQPELWYELSGPEQLAGLVALLDQGVTFKDVTIVLSGSIDLSAQTTTGQSVAWQPSGIAHPFEGTIIGNGNAIEGMTAAGDYAALLGATSGGSIESVQVSGTASGTKAAAGLVAIAKGTAFVACESDVAATTTGTEAMLGGIAAQASGCTFTQCENVGALRAASAATAPASYAGGITGIAVSCGFSQCTNSAGVQGAKVAGGIAGRAAAPSGTPVAASSQGVTSLAASAFTRCVNQGSVTGALAAGGLVGQATPALTVSESVNYGAIQGGGFSTSQLTVAGGLVGAVGAGASAVTVADSCNIGSAWAVSASSAPGSAAGGLVGQSAAPVTVKRAYSFGAVSATGGTQRAKGMLVGALTDEALCTAEAAYLVDPGSVAALGSWAGGTDAGVPGAEAVTAAEAPYLVPRLGSAFAYSKYFRGLPVLVWRTSCVTLTYYGVTSEALEAVHIESGAALSQEDLVKLYTGATPACVPPAGELATFVGWTAESGGTTEASFDEVTKATGVYPLFKYVKEPTVQPGSGTQGESGSGGSGSGSAAGNGSGSLTSAVDKWVKSQEKWWYSHADGTYTTSGWECIDGAWYYFDADGWMQVGWLHTGGAWYYLTASGAAAIGWEHIDGTWYYFNTASQGTECAMHTGWLHDGGTWYYLRSSGAMATGWLQDGGCWYYLGTNGAMRTGWLRIGDSWYYLTSSGAAAVGWRYLDGSWYYFNTASQGTECAMRTAPLDENGTRYYFSATGAWIS